MISPDAALLDAIEARSERLAPGRPSVGRRRAAAGRRAPTRAAARASSPTRSPPSTSSWSGDEAEALAGRVRARGLRVRGPRRRHRVRRLRGRLEPRAAHRRRGALPVGALARPRSGAGWLAYPCPARPQPASRPPAPRSPAPRAFPYTPSPWSAAREPHRRDPPHDQRDRRRAIARAGRRGRGRALDRRRLLRPHARRAWPATAASTSTCRSRATSRPAPTTRWRTPARARAGARRGARRSRGHRAASATRSIPMDEARARAARSTSRAGRSRSSRRDVPAARGRRLRHRPGRGVPARGGQHRQATLHVRVEARHQRAPHGRGGASRPSRARCAQAVAIDPTRDRRALHQGAPVSARVAILDYGMGNLRSVEKALEHVGADARAHARPRRASARPTAWCCRAWARCPKAMEHVRAPRARRADARARRRGRAGASASAWACSCSSSPPTELGGAEGIGLLAGAVERARRAAA